MVDDTPSGAPLREQLAPAFDAFEASLEANAGASIRDPAVWLPIDRSVVIAHPSAGAGARFSSPATDPTLRWRENNQSSAGRAAWLTAVHQALEAQPGAVGAPFQALAAFHDTSTLLHGTRQPATVEERSLLAAQPNGPDAAALVSVAVATEDESPGAASQYTDEQPDSLIVPAANLATADPLIYSLVLGTRSRRERRWSLHGGTSRSGMDTTSRRFGTFMATMPSSSNQCISAERRTRDTARRRVIRPSCQSRSRHAWKPAFAICPVTSGNVIFAVRRHSTKR